MKSILAITIIMLTINTYADERACLEKDFAAFQRGEGIIGPVPKVDGLPKEVKTRAQFKSYIKELSGGGVIYFGICGLTQDDLFKINSCYQNSTDQLTGGAITIPSDIYSDFQFQKFMDQTSGGAVIFEGSCEI